MEKEVKKAQEHVRDKQNAYWGNVASAGANTAAKSAQTESAGQAASRSPDASTDEKTSSRQRMTQ